MFSIIAFITVGLPPTHSRVLGIVSIREAAMKIRAHVSLKSAIRWAGIRQILVTLSVNVQEARVLS